MDSETAERLRLPSPSAVSSFSLSLVADTFHNSSPVLGVDDIDDAIMGRSSSLLSVSSSSSSQQQQNQNQIVVMSREAWEMTGRWIDRMQHEIQEWEDTGILGRAIIRACHELADTMAHLTTQLQQQRKQQQQQQSDDDYIDDTRKVVPSLLVLDSNNVSQPHHELFEHSFNSLLLQIQEVNNNNTNGNTNNIENDSNWNAVYDVNDFHDHHDDVSQILQEHNLPQQQLLPQQQPRQVQIDPLPPVIDLLTDLEQALRSVDTQDANDLAEAAITVGYIGLAALHHCHSQIVVIAGPTTQEHIRGVSRQRVLQESPNITRIYDGDNEIDNTTATTVPTGSPLSTNTTTSTTYQPYRPKRVRCLWPPLQPMAHHILHYTQEELLTPKQPIYITAPILLFGWPFLVTTAVVGSGMVVTDQLLQHMYSNVQDHPIVVTCEMSLASALQTMKLGYLTTKAVAKPTIRVVQKQIQRHAPQVQESLHYHIHHPIETVQSTVRNVAWCGQRMWQWVGRAVHDWVPAVVVIGADDAVSVSGPMLVDADATGMLQTMPL